MAKIETLICDRCKAQASTTEEKEKLGLGRICLGFDISHSYASPSSAPRIYAPHTQWEKEWCRKCRTDLGILEPEIRKAQQTGTPVPTLEDIIREIVADQAEASVRQAMNL